MKRGRESLSRSLRSFGGFCSAAALSLLMLAGCAAPAPQSAAVRTQANSVRAKADSFLCVIEPNGDQASTVKVMNLANRQLRAVYLPGLVQSMDADRARNKLYFSVRTEGPRFDLYELDVATLTLNRPASFTQVGLMPVDFRMRDQRVFVAGRREGRGQLLGHPLQQGGWESLAFDFLPGRLEWASQPNLLQSVFFDEDNLVRTTIDVVARRIVKTQTFPHGIPFGNNVGMATPDGEFFYALHQLQGLVEIYAFDIARQVMAKEITTEQAVGILFSSAISKDGRFLYATIDNRLERYELQGTSMKHLPPVTLNFKEARYLTLSEDQHTLYVTHDGRTSVSRIHIAPDNINYTVDEIAFPGQNNEVIVF